MPVCSFTSLLNYEYSNLLIVAAFSIVLALVIYLHPKKVSYLPTFSDDKAKILAVCLSVLY